MTQRRGAGADRSQAAPGVVAADAVARRTATRVGAVPAELAAPERRGAGADRPGGSPGCAAGWRAPQATLGRGLLALLSRDALDETTWDEIEETLLLSDLGVAPATELVERLRARVQGRGHARPRSRCATLLREELLALVDPDAGPHASHRAARGRQPAVVLVVGVNGTGKTTTAASSPGCWSADGRTVLLGAADTFRAAAADQLQTWGERVGVPTPYAAPRAPTRRASPSRPSRPASTSGVDIVLIDTAGRLHTKTGLMDELGKVKRVVEKQAPVDEVLLVLDATTGQNGLQQARVFAEVVDVTGIVLTKLDGTAKGGIVVAVQRELGVPVKLVGLGEGVDDLAPFDPERAFVDALLGLRGAASRSTHVARASARGATRGTPGR